MRRDESDRDSRMPTTADAPTDAMSDEELSKLSGGVGGSGIAGNGIAGSGMANPAPGGSSARIGSPLDPGLSLF